MKLSLKMLKNMSKIIIISNNVSFARNISLWMKNYATIVSVQITITIWNKNKFSKQNWIVNNLQNAKFVKSYSKNKIINREYAKIALVITIRINKKLKIKMIKIWIKIYQ
jgi:hypothetical protein